MPQSFACVHLHIVFSTKNREPWLDPPIAEHLYNYFPGILSPVRCRLLAAGGIADHVHLLVSLGRQIDIAKLLQLLKANSSKWIHEEFPQMKGFNWQVGYGAFSVSYGNLKPVKRYIATQEEHHRTQTFQEEFIEFLQLHEIEYDERYLWE